MAFRQAIEAAWWKPGLAWPAWLLLPLAGVYRLLWAAHRFAYRAGLRKPNRCDVPVVVVGNLIVGGAGKTPTTIALVQAMRHAGWTPGVITRGYGARLAGPRAVRDDSRAEDCGDEPLLIRRRTGAPVFAAPRRFDAARALLQANPEVDLLIADDGLQHLALARDAEVIVFDSRGAGNGSLLPAGPLREPLALRPPERSVVVYNAAAPSTPWPGLPAIRTLAGATPLVAWWHGAAPSPERLRQLAGARVLAVAGIAEPERFFTMLEAAGLTIDRLPLPDHARLDPRPWPLGTLRIVVTEKDAARIAPDAPDAGSIDVVTLDFTLAPATLQALGDLLPPPASHPARGAAPR